MPATIIRKQARSQWKKNGAVLFGYTKEEIMVSLIITCGLIMLILPKAHNTAHTEGSALWGFVYISLFIDFIY